MLSNTSVVHILVSRGDRDEEDVAVQLMRHASGSSQPGSLVPRESKYLE